MISYIGYYYKDIWNDTVPKDYPLFVICAGYYKPVTLPFLDCTHPSRNDYQILYIRNGCMYYEDENGKESKAEKGSFVLFKPHEWQAYRYYLKDNSEVYWVHFGGSVADTLLKNQGIFEKRYLPAPENEHYEHIFRAMISELRQKKEGCEELCTLYLKELVITLSREHKLSLRPQKDIPQEVEKIMRYMEENYQNEIYLDELAQSHYISKSWLIRQFNEYLGQSPIKFLNSIRIKQATLLLQSSNNIGDIAKAVGFPDQFYFSKVFKTAVGMSPKKYREFIK